MGCQINVLDGSKNVIDCLYNIHITQELQVQEPTQMIHCLANKDHGLHINVLFNSSRKTTKKPFSVYHRMAAAHEHEVAATESEASKAASGVRERKLRQVQQGSSKRSDCEWIFSISKFLRAPDTSNYYCPTCNGHQFKSPTSRAAGLRRPWIGAMTQWL